MLITRILRRSRSILITVIAWRFVVWLIGYPVEYPRSPRVMARRYARVARRHRSTGV